MTSQSSNLPNAGNADRDAAEDARSPLGVIFEDAEWLVVNKPAGLVCHPTKHGEWSSLIGRARLRLGAGGQPRLVNRLDRETSGVVLIAKTPEAARELGKIWESRAVRKIYLAVVRGHLRDEHGVVDAPLGRDEGSAVVIKDCVRPDGAPARTEFWLERRFHRAEGAFSLLRVAPQTGRKHQIRIHLAHVGHPIVGDKIYGGDERLYLDFVEGRLDDAQRRGLLLPHHGLHAAEVRFSWRQREMTFGAEPEAWFRDFVAGGETDNARCPPAGTSGTVSDGSGSEPGTTPTR